MGVNAGGFIHLPTSSAPREDPGPLGISAKRRERNRVNQVAYRVRCKACSHINLGLTCTPLLETVRTFE